jgi:Ligated ion channel L-glutamate- and glycine-binding site
LSDCGRAQQTLKMVDFSPEEQILLESTRLSGGLKIAVVASEPFVYDCPKFPNCDRPGVLTELTQVICSALAVPCEIVHWNGIDVGDEMNGTWTGLIGEILNGTHHTVPYIHASQKRLKVLDFSEPFFDTTTVLLTRAPSEPDVSMTSLLAFKWDVWLTLCFTVVCIGMSGDDVSRVPAGASTVDVAGVMHSPYRRLVQLVLRSRRRRLGAEAMEHSDLASVVGPLLRDPLRGLLGRHPGQHAEAEAVTPFSRPHELCVVRGA